MGENTSGKICTKCIEFKDYKFFYKRKALNDGHKSECMRCSRKASTLWKESNKDKVMEYSLLKYHERTNEDRIKWKKSNPIGYLVNNAKTNSKRYNRKFEISKEIISKKWQDQRGMCYYTGKPMKYDIGSDDCMSIDRKDSSEGYTVKNTVLCRYRVNVMKNNASLKDLLIFAQDVVKTLSKIK